MNGEDENYNYKSFYGDIENCNAKTDNIDRVKIGFVIILCLNKLL